MGATGVWEEEEEEPSGVTSPVVPPMARVRTTVPTAPANITGMSEELRLTFRIVEMELEAMHLKVKLLQLERQPRVPPQSPDRTSPRDSFDVSRHIALVPPFREAEVDS